MSGPAWARGLHECLADNAEYLARSRTWRADDAHDRTPWPASPDGRVQRLAPGSHPVYRVTDAALDVIVKLGRDGPAVIRECAALDRLGEFVRVPERALVAVDGRPVLVMPWVPGALASETARLDPCRFVTFLDAMVHDWRAMTLQSQRPAGDELRWTGQDPALLRTWLEEIAALAADELDARWEVDGTPEPSTLRDELRLAHDLLGSSPRWTALSTGDNHLNNFWVTEDGWYCFDAEYTGHFDVDYTVAKLLGSCVKHAGLVVVEEHERIGDQVVVSSRPSSPAARHVLGVRAVTARVHGVHVDWARVSAYVLAKLRFRFDGTRAGNARARGYHVAVTRLCRGAAEAQDA